MVSRENANLTNFAWRVVIAITIAAAAALIWYTGQILLVAFAGILLAIVLDYLARKLSEAGHMSHGWAFTIVVLTLAVLLSLAGWIAVPRISDQLNRLIHIVPQGMERFRAYLETTQWGETLLGYMPSMLASAHLTSQISSLAMKALDGVAGIVIIVIVGIYLGANPSFYERGLLKLIPGQHRDRARDVLNEVAYTLRWWVLGQLVPMTVLGVATTIGLYIMHVQLAFTLGLFTGLLIFIPYIGALIALVVTVLVTMVQGATEVLYVTIFFLAIHCTEGYLLTPLVQRRAVYLPPGLSIVTQVIMGLLLGFLGLALATPFTAAAMVLVQMLYLHERPEHHR